MQINATIKVVGEKRTGISKSSGNPWQRQDIILGWVEPGAGNVQHEQLLLVTLYGKGVSRFEELELGVGSAISGDLSFNTRNNNGFVNNDITLYL